MKRPKRDYVIQTVTNAVRLLESFRDEEALGVTELARRLELHKNNVFRLLATLEENGYVEQASESDRYRLGVRCLELGTSFARTHTLARHGRDALEELARETGESTHLGALHEFEVVHLDGAQPDRLVLSGSRVGRRLPAHCTALGKVLLACTDGGVQERFDRERVRERGLPAWTAATLCDREKFFEHLRGVAGQGFAVDLEECQEGLCCAAAPVRDGSGRVVAALSLSAPAFRMDAEALAREGVPRVCRAAELLSRRLGYATA